ncbi:MAG TPA: hypothetical protein PKL57_21375 [Candidatus Wallbacteria bacterium]|nr:hypothetical protein [Candidatus Wallbacteria bacterium]
MPASFNKLEMLSKLSAGEVFFSPSGSRSFDMLARHLDRVYASMGFSKIIFLDNFDLYNNFILSSGFAGAPERFYLIDVQNVQKNVSSSREALFEKNFCDMAFSKTEKLGFPLLFTDIVSAYKKLFASLEIPLEINIFTGDTSENKRSLFQAASEIFKSLSLKFETKSSFELDDFLEIKFYTRREPGGAQYGLGLIPCDGAKILFSLTGGIEKIIREKLACAPVKIPFIINPFQLVVITDKVSAGSNVFKELDAIEKKGHSVVWHETGAGSALNEADVSRIVREYKDAGAHTILAIPDFGDCSKAFLYRGPNQKICGMDFFQLNSIYLQKDFKGCE